MTSIAEVSRVLTVHIDVCKAAPELHIKDMHHLEKIIKPYFEFDFKMIGNRNQALQEKEEFLRNPTGRQE
jgi:hypothetical protein